MAGGFCADSELSEVLSKLWELDDNKCYPGEDYEIDLQGFVTSTRDCSRDFARKSLFKWVDEDKVFSRETYRTFHDLLDNYEMDVSEAEEVTWEERKENWNFLEAIMKTEVMKEAHRFLASKGVAPDDDDDFKKMLHDIWFKLFRRKGGRSQNSCSFEHVFVGEGRGDDFIGLHNWIQFYLQEKAGNIDYHGFFRRETVRDDEIIRLIAMQFDWRDQKSKPLCSCFIGSSPEFEIAAYTVCLLLDRDGKIDCKIGEYEVELTVHSFGWNRKLGSAFMSASRLH
ncbi:poly(U)-specific endoribonuclease-A-like [Littorina saxatilis]|uniref:Uridylate-specific endoribonuclease n=1 Tax=Littorina saxatilis TaxID=31220 RepID=A0AAN9B673_9CAEN